MGQDTVPTGPGPGDEILMGDSPPASCPAPGYPTKARRTRGPPGASAPRPPTTSIVAAPGRHDGQTAAYGLWQRPGPGGRAGPGPVARAGPGPVA